MKFLRTMSVILPAIAAAGISQAQGQPQGQDALYIRSVAATCASCHGTQGVVAAGSSVPSLAGAPRDYLLTQMRDFKSGVRPATIMHQLAKGYSDAQIEQIAAYFAAQKK